MSGVPVARAGASIVRPYYRGDAAAYGRRSARGGQAAIRARKERGAVRRRGLRDV